MSCCRLTIPLTFTTEPVVIRLDPRGWDRDPREPLSFNFSSPEGECTLKLISEHYEHVEFTWFVEEHPASKMPPILILKAKK